MNDFWVLTSGTIDNQQPISRKMLCRCYRYAVFTPLVVAIACFLQPRAEAATTGPAFAVGHTLVSLKTRESQLMLLASTDNANDGASRARVETTRREYAQRSLLQAAKVMGIATTASWNKISVAKAATVSTTEPKQQAAALQSWLCDPTVYSWKKQGRTVHIVGTSHISSVSADLAGNVVREVQVRVCDMTTPSMRPKGNPTPFNSFPARLFVHRA